MAEYETADHGDDHKDLLEICIEDMIHKIRSLSHKKCIYRVPKKLRDLNEKAYTPQIVSIGPFHCGNKKLQAMEYQKPIYLQECLASPDSANLGNFIRMIRKKEAKIRSHYDETIEPISSDEFVKTILLDSAFIIQVMLNDAKLVPHLSSHIKSDLVLLENQIPFFIIELLFNATNLDPQRSFIQACFEFFKEMFSIEGLEYSNSLQYKAKHFVDLLRFFHLSSCPKSKSHSGKPYLRIDCATQLKKAGIKFRTRPSKCLVDIAFDNNIKSLKIPRLVVCDCTKSLLRNMVALEQFQYPQDSYITNYVIFLDNLIDTHKDADVLIESQIINNNLADSSAVSKLFNNLSDELTILLDNYNYHAISQDLNKHCKSSWNKWKATLKHDYCRTPWMIGSTTAAIVLLIFTLIQTICSIIDVA